MNIQDVIANFHETTSSRPGTDVSALLRSRFVGSTSYKKSGNQRNCSKTLEITFLFLFLCLSLSSFRLSLPEAQKLVRTRGKTFFYLILLFYFRSYCLHPSIVFVCFYAIPLFLCVYSFPLPGVARSPQPDARVPTLVINFPRLQQQDPRPLPLHP